MAAGSPAPYARSSASASSTAGSSPGSAPNDASSPAAARSERWNSVARRIAPSRTATPAQPIGVFVTPKRSLPSMTRKRSAPRLVTRVRHLLLRGLPPHHLGQQRAAQAPVRALRVLVLDALQV